MYNKLPFAVRHWDGLHRIYMCTDPDSSVNGMCFFSQSTARTWVLVMILVNDCRSNVSLVNNSDSDCTIRVLCTSHL